MWENIVIVSVVALCAFFIGRRFIRQWRAAVSGKSVACCSESTACGCCSGSTSCTGSDKLSKIGKGA